MNRAEDSLESASADLHSCRPAHKAVAILIAGDELDSSWQWSSSQWTACGRMP
jgi:hypothetical protein